MTRHQDTASMGHDTAVPRVRACCSAHAHSLANKVCHNTNDCILIGGVGLASRHSAPGSVIRRCDTAQCARDMAYFSRYNFVS